MKKVSKGGDYCVQTIWDRTKGGTDQCRGDFKLLNLTICVSLCTFNCAWLTQDLHTALVACGLNPMEQEVIDMTNTVARNGLIFFPEFCQIVLKRFREENEEEFAQVMFKVTKVLCGNLVLKFFICC